MPKGFPPVTLKEFQEAMRAYGYIQLKNDQGGSHIAFISQEDFDKMAFHNLIFAESKIGATIPHGGKQSVPIDDVKMAIKKLKTTKEEFFSKIGKQLPGKKKKRI